MRKSEMSPDTTIFYGLDRDLADSEIRSNQPSDFSGSEATSDLVNLSDSQYGIAVPFASNPSPVLHRIFDILAWRGPAEIIKSVILIVAVAVSYLMGSGRAWSMKSCAYKARNSAQFTLAVVHKRKEKIAV